VGYKFCRKSYLETGLTRKELLHTNPSIHSDTITHSLLKFLLFVRGADWVSVQFTECFVDNWPSLFKSKMPDAYAILGVRGTFVEALQIEEEHSVSEQILSRFRIETFITLILLSQRTKEYSLRVRNIYTLGNWSMSVEGIHIELLSGSILNRAIVSKQVKHLTVFRTCASVSM
jgi:hypothetical protein